MEGPIAGRMEKLVEGPMGWLMGVPTWGACGGPMGGRRWRVV